jgi:protein-S-isoprenylcysteine O-methyltransferase Ste14
VTPPPPPVVALAAVVAQQVLTRGARRPTGFRAVASSATAAASVALAVTAARQFRSRGTTLEPSAPSKASVLVTTGPNAVSRNPMYLGLTGLLFANAMRLGSWRALLPLAAFTLVIDRLQIPAEESALLAKFGAPYEAYRRAVPRWLGPGSIPRGRQPMQAREI